MKPVRITLLVLIASLLFPAGCVSTGHHGQSTTSSRSVRNEAGIRRLPYELPKSAAHLSLSLTLRASEGSFVYTLVDPHGTVVWQGRVSAGQSCNETRPFTPVPGKWLLTLEMENATGSYDIAWKSE
ncbi:MAG: hypothetical protein NTZ17_17680 [Phycisphaerae bacterium]|nr:hypothetical protein [Phycisphaerae bacterium]